MRSRRMIGVVLGIVFVMAAGLTGCNFSGISDAGKDSANIGGSDVGTVEPGPEQPVEDKIENAVENGGHYAMPAKMSFTSKALAAAGETGITATLTATVEPADAADKSVDWSVMWDESATLKTSAVTDYITVTPASDGSTTATVTCKKAFGNDKIIIKVKTRDGGFEAFCTVTFVGIPTSISITTDIAMITVSQGERNPYKFDCYPVGSNKTVEMEIVLDNGVHDVAESYYETCEVSVKYPTVLVYLTTSSTDLDPTPKPSDEHFTNTNLTVSVNNKKLMIHAADCIEAGYAYMREGGKHGAFYRFFTDSELQGPVITVKCGTLTATVPLKIISSVTNVTVNSNLQF